MNSKLNEAVNYGFLDQHIGFQVHLSRRAIWHNVRGERSKGRGKPPSGYNTALIVIGLNPGIAPKQLAASLYLDPQATASILDRLEQDGFAVRTRSAIDKRRVELRLSERGEEEMAHIEERSNVQEANLARSFTLSERRSLVHLLAKLRTSLEAETGP